jgi:hypothetical protein
MGSAAIGATMGATVAAHADWSVDAAKRWMVIAIAAEGGWRVGAPVPVGPVSSLLARLRALAGGGAVALGVDLPLGVPRAYARNLPLDSDFPAFLRGLSADAEFFRVCATLDEVSVARPFFPARGIAGMRRAAHAAMLGMADPADLSRLCDRATAERPAGASLFWTLGANQSGKAALSAWREMLLPALAGADPPRLWPFEGGLHALLAGAGLVVAETYPAEALRHLHLSLTGSKRRRADRARLAPALLAAMARLAVRPDPPLRAVVADGFGADAAGEDRFDCTVGLLCLLNVLGGHRPDFIPDDPWIRRWEGWVLGQTAMPRG